jgi:Ca2+/H+ antiporter
MQSSGKSSTGELLTNFCYIFTITGIVTFIICFSLQEKYKEEVVKNTMKASTMRMSPLMVGPSMIAEEEKHMDGEINAMFSLTL